MAKLRGEEFYEEVWSVVSQIPPGKVLSYGQIARLTGCPDCSRMVGRAMWAAPAERMLPCHRVVNSVGRIAPACPEHREKLTAEGVIFKRNGFVDMKASVWETDKE